MKNVAASKLKQAEKSKDAVQPFLNATKLLLKNVPVVGAATKQTFVVMTSDRGLCGSANSTVIRYTNRTAQLLPQNDLEFFVIGDKGRNGVVRNFKNQVTAGVSNLGKKPLAFSDLGPFVQKIVNSPGEKITIVSNHYINSILFEVQALEFPSKNKVVDNWRELFKEYDIEGDEREIVSDMYDFFIHSLVYGAIIENAACELSARMSSMDNATKNANEMIIKLNLDCNRKRQAGITKELNEIVSGASAVESGVEW
jgi:ATP synthase F1 gamma subunit